MEEQMQKSYYAIIPANVRYDSGLTPNSKLLYGEITALCNEKGFCWANNEYFANLYGVSKVSISKWINQLVAKGYIFSEIIYKEGTKEILNRYLRIVNDPIKEKFNTPIKEKFKDNNTYINNTYNKRNNKEKKYIYYGEYQNVFFTDEQYEKIKNYFPKDYEERIQKLDDYMQSSGKKYKDCLATLRNWARKEGYIFPKPQKQLKECTLTEEEYFKRLKGE